MLLFGGIVTKEMWHSTGTLVGMAWGWKKHTVQLGNGFGDLC